MFRLPHHRPFGQSHTRSRRSVRVLAAFTAVAVLAVAPAAYAKPAGAAGPKAAPSPSIALATDLSATLPPVKLPEVTGDFLGEGHDQRAYLKLTAGATPGPFASNSLVIAEADKYGGAVHKTMPTDMYSSGTGMGDPFDSAGTELAASGSTLYMAGLVVEPGPPQALGLNLYRVPTNGSCAQAACLPANARATLPGVVNIGDGLWVTSLAVGVVSGKTLIAVGMTTGAAQDIAIYRDDAAGGLTFLTYLQQDAVHGVTTLAFGPPTAAGQSGLLIAGVSDAAGMWAYRLNADGTQAGTAQHGDQGASPYTAAVLNISGEQVAAIGQNGDGDIWLVNPSTGQIISDLPVGLRPQDWITSLTALTPANGTSSSQDLVVATKGGAADEVLSYSDGTWSQLPLEADGTKLVTNDQLDAWYPGYGAGRLTVKNATATPVSVSMSSRPDPDYGCWLNAAVSGGPTAFPTAATELTPNQVSPTYFIGALTAGAWTPGAQDNCAAAQAGDPGEKAAYLVVTPDGDPADQLLIKLMVDSSGTVKIADQVGGDLKAQINQQGHAIGNGSWGNWALVVTGPGTGVVSEPPTIVGYRLTAPPIDANQPDTGLADDPHRPVYRFDVSGAQWQTGAGAGQATATIPAMTAQGSTDGTHWSDLGQLMPATQPTVIGNRATLGPASFFTQADYGVPMPAPWTDVRVVFGSRASNAVHLASLAAPPTNGGANATAIQSLAVATSTTPRANGVDQAPLTLALAPANAGGVISASDPRYQLIYYRNSPGNTLITGLYTSGDYEDYISIAPWRGAYPNDGSSPAALAARQAAPTATSGAVSSTKSSSLSSTEPSSASANCAHGAHCWSPPAKSPTAKSSKGKPSKPTCPPCPEKGRAKRNEHCGGSKGGSGGGSKGGSGGGSKGGSKGGSGGGSKGGSGGGLGSGAPNQVHTYLVTTSLSSTLTAAMNDTGTPSGDYVSPALSVTGVAATITASGTVSTGLTLNGCSGGACTLVAPTAAAPALYQAGNAADGPATGLMFSLNAVTAASTLPLQVGTGNAHAVAQSPISITNNQAQLSSTSAFWPTDRLDVSLVAAGQLVRVLGTPVQQ